MRPRVLLLLLGVLVVLTFLDLFYEKNAVFLSPTTSSSSDGKHFVEGEPSFSSLSNDFTTDKALLTQLRQHNKVIFLIHVRGAPSWQLETLRRQFQHVLYLFVVDSDSNNPADTSGDVLILPSGMNQATFWSQIHQHLHRSMPFVITWMVQLEADCSVDLRKEAILALRQYENSELPLVIGCPHLHRTCSKQFSHARLHDFQTWSPLVLNQAMSQLLASNDSTRKQASIRLVQDPQFIYSDSLHHCHFQNPNITAWVRPCQTWASMIQPVHPLHHRHSTFVTVLFNIDSKHSMDRYVKWMKIMLAIQDPIIVFCDNYHVEPIRQARTHALNRTLIVPMNLTDVPVASLFSEKFWQQQLRLDWEQEKHKSYHLFWIWLSKSWFVQEAIRLNPFQSDIFVYSDIGSFRWNTDNVTYPGQWVVRYPDLVPRHSMLQMAHKPVQVFMDIWLRHKKKGFFYHSGSQAVGYQDTWRKYHQELQITLHHFANRGYFVGEDQLLMQHTCVRCSPLCLYVDKREVFEDSYFGLKHLLHFGGDHQYLLTPMLANVTNDPGAPHVIQITHPNLTTSPRAVK